jgi:hypothetical protein
MKNTLNLELSELYTISTAHGFDSPVSMLDSYIEVLRQSRFDLVTVKLPRLLSVKLGSETVKVKRSRMHFTDWFMPLAIEWEAEKCAKRIIELRHERSFDKAEYRPKRRLRSLPEINKNLTK